MKSLLRFYFQTWKFFENSTILKYSHAKYPISIYSEAILKLPGDPKPNNELQINKITLLFILKSDKFSGKNPKE